MIPNKEDVLITHEPPYLILDESHNTHWGNALLFKAEPHYHLVGHEHDNQGIIKERNTIFANGAVLDDQYNIREKYNLFIYI